MVPRADLSVLFVTGSHLACDISISEGCLWGWERRLTQTRLETGRLDGVTVKRHPKTDVTPATLLRNFIARENRKCDMACWGMPNLGVQNPGTDWDRMRCGVVRWCGAEDGSRQTGCETSTTPRCRRRHDIHSDDTRTRPSSVVVCSSPRLHRIDDDESLVLYAWLISLCIGCLQIQQNEILQVFQVFQTP